MLSSQSQSFFVTSDTNHANLFPWKRTWLARPVCTRKSAGAKSVVSHENARRPLCERTVDHITIKFESSVIEDKVNPTAGLDPEILDGVPEFAHVVAQDVLFSSSEVLSTRRLKRLDLLLGHVNEKRQISRVPPQANYCDGESYLGRKEIRRRYLV